MIRKAEDSDSDLINIKSIKTEDINDNLNNEININLEIKQLCTFLDTLHNNLIKNTLPLTNIK